MTLDSKKGQVELESIVLIIGLFVLVIAGIALMIFLDPVNDAIQADPDLANISKETIDHSITNFPTWIDNVIVMFLLLAWGGMLTASFLVDNHPIFFWLAILLFIGVLVVAAIFANTWDSFAESDGIDGYQDQIPMTNFIMSNLLIVLLAVGGSTIFVLYAKNKQGAIS